MAGPVPEENPGKTVGEGVAQLQWRPQDFGDVNTMG